MEEALYDGEGQRVQQIDESNTSHTTTQHTYVGGESEDVASQWANTGGSVTTTTTAYYSGGAQSVNGALSYTLADGLGSVSASVNASGTVTASQLYGPYGGVRYQNSTLPTDYAFTHQRSDATSGLDYYGARYYDPVSGQFTSADTTLAGGLNLYGYVSENPESAIDPSGHIYARPHDYNQSFAMYQVNGQPAKAYVNQWAAPCDWGCTTKLVGQAVLGTDTINRSYHVMTDPHASAGDRWKAAGIFAFTVVGDAVTVGSLFFGQAEVGTGVRAADEALLAASDIDHLAVATTAGDVGSASETYYRTMSQADFEALQETGNVSPTKETFISPSQAFSSGYDGTTVKFTVEAGTQNALAGVGVRDTSRLASAAYPDMPLVSSGWTYKYAFFKGEGNVLNIGLGRGPALDIFNRSIQRFEEVP